MLAFVAVSSSGGVAFYVLRGRSNSAGRARRLTLAWHLALGCVGEVSVARWVFLTYGIVAYLLFIAAILYGIGFVGDIVVPKSIDGPTAPVTTALVIAIDVLLLAAFAVQHNVMARLAFKKWWTRFVPPAIERSTFVAAASMLLLLLYWQWLPIPDRLWQIEHATALAAIWTLYAVGWLIVFYSTFLIDHFELFGLKQVYRHFRGLQPEMTDFSERSLYRWVRHPLMLGFLIAFWAAPTMTLGRLLFAGVCTVWIFFSIWLEERDLLHILGEPYRRYRGRTSMILPLPRGVGSEDVS
jgi:methanethiol S-methyltransferase